MSAIRRAASSLRRVAVLDDYHNLSAEYLAHLHDALSITTYRDTLPFSPALVERLKPYSILVTMRERTPISKELIDSLPNLEMVLTTGMRNRGIEVEYAKDKGIVVAGTPFASSPPDTPPGFATTVQHTWSLVLSLSNNIPRDNNLVTSGKWLHRHPLNTYLSGLTLGLVGLGKLGAGVARIAKLAFGMKVIAWSPNLSQAKADVAAQECGLAPGDFVAVSKEDLFGQSDLVSVHMVLADSTTGIVGEAELGSMKKEAFLVNTSRGPLIDENALLDTLQQGRIRGYAGDVFDVEPLPLDSPWRTVQWGEDGRSEVVVTPHSGYAYEGQMRDMWEKTAMNLGRIARDEEVEWKM